MLPYEIEVIRVIRDERGDIVEFRKTLDIETIVGYEESYMIPNCTDVHCTIGNFICKLSYDAFQIMLETERDRINEDQRNIDFEI